MLQMYFCNVTTFVSTLVTQSTKYSMYNKYLKYLRISLIKKKKKKLLLQKWNKWNYPSNHLFLFCFYVCIFIITYLNIRIEKKLFVTKFKFRNWHEDIFSKLKPDSEKTITKNSIKLNHLITIFTKKLEQFRLFYELNELSSKPKRSYDIHPNPVPVQYTSDYLT